MKTLVALLIIGLGISGVFYYTTYLRAEAPPNFRTAVVERGDISIVITATGTVEPEEVVDVGTQVVGRIQEFGLDPRAATDPALKNKHIDYGSPVEEGTVLAQIDKALYEATRNQAKAALDRAQADLIQLEAKYDQTKAEWGRAQRLRELKLPGISNLAAPNGRSGEPTTIKGISDADYVLAKANYEVAKANVSVGQAAVKQQQATLDSAQTNLDYTTIKSPVKGTIIARRVNVGQTVVSSLNAPSLFLIARDLRRMEVWALVNEADIGQIKAGMPVHFAVDAYPGDVFRGEVRQIRLDAQMNTNIVLYTVVVVTNNDDLKLLPYLTANVSFEVDERKDVLRVPNAALRYRPRPELVAAAPSLAPAGSSAGGDDSDAERRRTVWIKKGNFVEPVEVEIGVTDGRDTEIVAGLSEGAEVVVGETLEQAVVETTNPLAPPRFRAPKKNDKKTS